MTTHTVGPPRLEEVSPGVYAYIQPDGSWMINNCGFVVGDDSVVVIDGTSTEKRNRAFHKTVKDTSDKPILTLVNTHSHPDHTSGNFLFSPPSTIVAHQRTRDEMMAGLTARMSSNDRSGSGPVLFEGLDMGKIEPRVPSVTFRERMQVYAGNTPIELIYAGTPAHTSGDIVAWLPESKVLFTGDLAFNKGQPLVGGSVAGWLEVLDLMRGLGAERVIPGHGDPSDPTLFDDLTSYLRFVQDSAADMEKQGREPLEYALAMDLGPFKDWGEPERIVGNLHRARFEQRGGERGAPIPGVNPFAEAIAYNGGKPLMCYA